MRLLALSQLVDLFSKEGDVQPLPWKINASEVKYAGQPSQKSCKVELNIFMNAAGMVFL